MPALGGRDKMTGMESARDRLSDEHAQARQRLADLTHDFAAVVAASRDTNADDEHDPEGATIAFERSQLEALVRQAERHLAEIEVALQRVEAGTYGVCEVCGEPIGEARLRARPAAGVCIACAGARRR
jgi:RNA polymerase-binding transcription factor